MDTEGTNTEVMVPADVPRLRIRTTKKTHIRYAGKYQQTRWKKKHLPVWENAKQKEAIEDRENDR